jgi:hypothetical protein
MATGDGELEAVATSCLVPTETERLAFQSCTHFWVGESPAFMYLLLVLGSSSVHQYHKSVQPENGSTKKLQGKALTFNYDIMIICMKRSDRVKSSRLS